MHFKSLVHLILSFSLCWPVCILALSSDSVAQMSAQIPAQTGAPVTSSDEVIAPSASSGDAVSASDLNTESGAEVNGARQPAAKAKTARRAKSKSEASETSETPAGLPETMTFATVSVKGNKKIEKDAIVAKLNFKTGQPVTRPEIRKAIEDLFATGYFADIQLHRDGSDLRIEVTEKPTIVEITFDGNNEFKDEELLENSSMKSFEIVNLAKIREAQDKIQKMYEDKGFYLARVQGTVQEVTKDQTVKVNFKIDENEKVKVKKITFLGNKALTQDDLRSRMQTAEGGFFSPIFGTGGFKQEAFDRDVTLLTFYYYSKGYVRAKIERPMVTVTPDRKSMYITFSVEEGEQYSVGSIDFAGDMLFPREELFETIKIDESEIFAYDVLQQDLSDLTAKYGDLGYAYANVVPKSIFHDDTRKVDLVFEFDKGEKVYFGRLNVVGNTKTRDKVLRRELRIREGELYHETSKRESIANIQRLGFFEEVNFKTSSVPDKPEIMNVDIVVKERSTGQIQLAAGYGSAQGMNFQGSVQQPNFLGKGQNLGVSIDLSANYSRFDLSFTEPYWNDSEWSIGGRVFKSISSTRDDFNEDKVGASTFLGHPLGKNIRGNISFAVTETKLTEVERVKKDPVTGAETKEVVTDYDLFPLSTVNGQSRTLGLSLEYDTRNDRIRPSEGAYGRTSYAYTGFGGNLNYYRGGLDGKFFKKLFWDVVWRNNLSYARVGSVNDQDVPFNERLLLGGPYSLRGYRSGRVGKQKLSNKELSYQQSAPPNGPGRTGQSAIDYSQKFFGGTQQMLVQSELQFPLIREADMFFVAFYDAGIAQDDFIAEDIFSDVGLGVRWFSPIGPLRFEWGFPMKRDPIFHPDPVVFEFSIGAPF